MIPEKYWIYIIHCNNGSYYTGYTNNLIRRYNEHVKGTTKCKFTRSFKPQSLAQSWVVDCKSEAMKIENFIKRLNKNEKELLILNPETLVSLFKNDL